MNKTYNFRGVINTIEPLTVTLKGAVTPSGHRLPRNGNYASQPYFPASSLRGALRHAAHLVALDKLHDFEGPQAFDLAEHFMLAQGVDIAGRAEDIDSGTVDGSKNIRNKNPLISLFGRWGVAGKAAIGNAHPTGDNQWAMFGGGARTIMFERNEELLSLLDDEQIDRLEMLKREQAEASIDIQQFKNQQSELKKRLKIAGKEEKEGIFKQIQDLDDKIQLRKDAKTEARESIRRPLDQYEAFVAGASLQNKMSLRNVSDIELGLFLATLVRFASDPRLGGHASQNCGLVSASWDISTWTPNSFQPANIGRIELNQDGVTLNGDELHTALEQFKACKDIDFRVF